MKKLSFLLLALLFSLSSKLSAKENTVNPSVLSISAKYISPKLYQIFKEGETITVKIDVNSFTPIHSMKLYLNGKKIGVDKKAPFEWTSQNTPGLRNLKPGGYVLKCRIRDSHRKNIFIQTKFKVVRGSKPCISNASFTYPNIRKLLFEGDYLYVKVDPKVRDDVNFIAFYFDNRLIRSDKSYPFEWGRIGKRNLDPKLGKLRFGPHKLRCVIRDKCGNSRTITRTIMVERRRSGGLPRK